jgi:hypothetical protein
MFMWEVVSLLQMVVLVAISVFSHTLGLYYSALLLLTAFAVVFAMHDFFRPYRFPLLNQVALLSFSCLFITTTIAMSLFTVDVAAPFPYGEIMGVIGLLLNVGFIIWTSYLVAVHSSGIVSRWMRKAKAWVLVIERRCLCDQVCFSDARDGGTASRHYTLAGVNSLSLKESGSAGRLGSKGSNAEISVSKSVVGSRHEQAPAGPDVETGRL